MSGEVKIELVERPSRLHLPRGGFVGPTVLEGLVRLLRPPCPTDFDEGGTTLDHLHVPDHMPTLSDSSMLDPSDVAPTVRTAPLDLAVGDGGPPADGPLNLAVGDAGTPADGPLNLGIADEPDPAPTVRDQPVSRLPPPPSPPTAGGRAATLQERLRNLTAAQRDKLARTGEQTERIALERIYGKHVWESLLKNPKLTPPEVARISRMGALPQPLIELIVGNRGWLASAQVRRALLTNPRLRGELAHSVLRATPKAELKLIPKQTAYPAAIRESARSMLK